MGDDWEQYPPSNTDQPNRDDIDKRIEDIKRVIVQGANEAQTRFKRVVDKANIYWQQTQTTPTPQQSSTVEEHRIRQLVDMWSNENWRVARDLGTHMELVSWSTNEVWEISLETRWETRSMEIVSEPYAGRGVGMPQPLLPVWDYELPPVVGLKAPLTRTRIEGLDEVVSCISCNGTGRALCVTCTGRGWVVCPDCKGRTKKRCTNCRGRGYVADWTATEKKPFFKRQAENMASSFGSKVADVFDSIRQQGVPIPNPADTDPAIKGATLPCPDCVNGEVDCTCGNGKRICASCQGAKTSLCNGCGGTGKLVRHREIVRRFDQRSQARFIGECVIPAPQLGKANGELVYNAEISEPLYPDAAPERVPMDVWGATVELVTTESQVAEKPGVDPQTSSRPTLQVVELVRIPYTTVQYRYLNQDYVLHVYDAEGQEKFFADRYPARWDRIERLVKAITDDLVTPVEKPASASGNNTAGGYRVPIEVPPYNITEEGDEEHKP